MPARFTLDDAVALNREHPNTSRIPDAELRESLGIGDLVKLMFRIRLDGSDQVERMWVKITGIEGKEYNGVLENDATCAPDMNCGTPVRFRAKHVIQIWSD